MRIKLAVLVILFMMFMSLSAIADIWYENCSYCSHGGCVTCVSTDQGGGAYYVTKSCSYCGFYKSYGNHALCSYCSYTWCNWNYVHYPSGYWVYGKTCPYHGYLETRPNN